MAIKTVQFKSSLLINLTVAVAALGAIMLGISLFATQQTVARLSGMLTDQVIATTDAQVMRFFEPIMGEMEITTERTRRGEFETFPLDELDTYFQPLLDEMAQVSSIMYAHDNGDEYMLLQTQDRWMSRLIQPEGRSGVAVVRSWQTRERGTDSEEQPIDYDARERPWFSGALEKFEDLGEDVPLRERIHWTQPYRFFTTQEPGITASLAHRSDSGRIAILGFDILLADISRYTSQLKIGAHGSVFVLRGSPTQPDELVIIGLPADERIEGRSDILEFILRPPLDFGGPVASFVGEALIADDEQAGRAVRFIHDRQPWWGEIAPSNLRAAEDIWIGAVVPERELLAGLPNTNAIVLLATGIVLLLAVRRAYRLAHRYSAPVEALTQQGNRMQRLNFEPTDAVYSDITEIRHLSTTLERMRSALHSFTSSREDLRVARSIREQSLPTAISSPPGVEIDIWQEAAEELGGETYDVVRVRQGGVVMGFFDFPATGLAAAVWGVQLQAEFRAAAAGGGADLHAIAARLDQFVREERPKMIPLRACLFRIDHHRVLSVLDFGWDSLLHGRNGEVQRISSAQTALGFAPADRAAVRQIDLVPGDTVLLASDGVLDAMSSDRKRYGVDGIEQALNAMGERRSESLIEAIAADLTGYSKGVHGDRTLLVVRVVDGAEERSES